MGLSMEAVQSAAVRRTLADHSPDVLIEIPRSSCRTLDFHRAEAMIELGRRLAEEALDQAGHGVPGGSRPPSAAAGTG
jgi:NTE family protein